MIKKVRRKFIIIAMTAIIICTTILVTAINLTNYFQIDMENETMLRSIAENDGQFPGKPFNMQTDPFDNDGQPIPFMKKNFTAEAAYETRFFTVKFHQNGFIETNLRNIAAVDSDMAITMAKEKLESSKTFGYDGYYKFYVTTDELKKETLVVIMDCETKIKAMLTLGMTSALIALIGIIIMFLIITLSSRRVIKPLIESTEKQKQFITDASHELKTPLTVIGTNMDILEMDLGENEWVTGTKKQVGNLKTMVNQMVSLSRMEEEHQFVIKENFDFVKALSEAVEPYRAMAEFRGKTFHIETPENMQGKGDEGAIRQLITILCDNAIKYSDKDGRIDVKLYQQGKKSIIEVSNTCEEMVSIAAMSRLFDRFYRADAARTKENGKNGYGIGLAIAKAIVEKHNGKITVKQNEEKVIQFTVQI